MTVTRERLQRTLEDAWASDGLAARPSWAGLRDWLESNDEDPEVVIAAFEAEYDQVPFPGDAVEAFDVLARYLTLAGQGRGPADEAGSVGGAASGRIAVRRSAGERASGSGRG